MVNLGQVQSIHQLLFPFIFCVILFLFIVRENSLYSLRRPSHEENIFVIWFYLSCSYLLLQEGIRRNPKKFSYWIACCITCSKTLCKSAEELIPRHFYLFFWLLCTCPKLTIFYIFCQFSSDSFYLHQFFYCRFFYLFYTSKMF